MPFTVEYNAERDSMQSDANGISFDLAAPRVRESFATEAEAVDFIAQLPPLRDPVLVTEDGQRIRGPALGLHVVGWQDAR
jgi:hypothetical protein